MKKPRIVILLAISAVALYGCAAQRKITALYLNDAHAELSSLEDSSFVVDTARDNEIARLKAKEKAEEAALRRADSLANADTQSVEVLMENIRDSVTGEEMLHDKLKAAVVTARIPYRIERGGKVQLDFEVRVNDSMKMVDKNWQIHLVPDLVLLNRNALENIRDVIDSTQIDEIILTGTDFRTKQEQGYKLYNNFIKTIVTDSMKMVNVWQLEQFIKRNIPNLYKFKNDSSYVSLYDFVSAYGVDEQEAVEHYTHKISMYFNRLKISMAPNLKKRLIKYPILTEGVMLDTVVREGHDFIYKYTTFVTTKGRPTMNQALVYLSGGIYKYGSDIPIYYIPKTDSIVFPISSVKDMIRDTVMHKIGHRQVRLPENKEYSIEYAVGKDVISPSLGNNAAELSAIKNKIRELMLNKMYDLDSIVVTAAASPEGAWMSNASLANRRASSMINYIAPFSRYLRDSITRHRRDSLRRELDITGTAQAWDYDSTGRLVLVGEMSAEEVLRQQNNLPQIPDIKYISHSEPKYWQSINPEYWEKLDKLVWTDTTYFNDDYRSMYDRHSSISNPDSREAAMKADPYYRYMRDYFYPQLRVTRFEFLLHLKATVDETYVMDEVDTLYMEGLAACANRDWALAVDKFAVSDHPNDYNAAVAYLSMDRNLSACQILESQERTSDVNYMLALVYSRMGRNDDARDAFLNSVEQDEAKWLRGTKDPEIKSIIAIYRLKSPTEKRKEEEERKKKEAGVQEKVGDFSSDEELFKALGLSL